MSAIKLVLDNFKNTRQQQGRTEGKAFCWQEGKMKWKRKRD